MLTRGTRSRAFTLIELLVVVMIIFMLSGMLFTVANLAAAKATRAKNLAIIERMRNALTEFHSEYGMYPPVSTMTYERENTNLQMTAMITILARNDDPDDPTHFFPDIEGQYPEGRYMTPDELIVRQADGTAPWPVDTVFQGKGLGYRYGLVSYLWPRDQGDQEHFYDEDLPRDEHAKDNWSPYLDEVPLIDGKKSHELPKAVLGTTLIYSNVVHVVNDGWGHALMYSSPPPYSSFQLWSVGPDGVNNTPDDVGNDAFAE